ncbi:MAG: hypothetical protein CMJ83_21965 [Planctomycetes bacterium]|nr:hypothetical protein [Planctomycetota bacterium]
MLDDADRDPCDVVLRRTAALLDHVGQMPGAADPGPFRRELDGLKAKNRETDVADETKRYALFLRVCALRRRIAFSNPLLDFDRIVFLTHHKAKYDHMVDQYFGHFARPGGRVHVLEDPFGDSPRVRDLLKDVSVTGGRLNGKTLADGSFISLELDYDAKRIFFAWTEADPVVDRWNDRIPLEVLWKRSSTYHVFRADLEPGSPVRLTQLTDGRTNDFDPCVLPDGRVVFISERRGGFLRCGLRPDPTYTLHSMKDDGSDLRTISFHETNEWHPSVGNDGKIAYTRWDYVDRDSDIAHHLWTCYPDGRDPRSLHGNYPVARENRPWMELSIRAIPGSEKFVAVAAAHHGQAYGSLILIDPAAADDNAMSQVRRLTPDVLFPESESAPGRPHAKGRHNPRAEVFGSPWPLSEHFHLCVYDPGQRNYGLYLVDAFGNRELLYRDPVVPCLDPIPLRPRSRPPIIPSKSHAPDQVEQKDVGIVGVVNVYQSDFPWPDGAKIAAIRIIQIFPKTTPAAAEPAIGIGAQSLARGVLGTVPVEADGSAHFVVPARVPIYFQALDGDGLAIQSMRSNTYLHRGERLTCVGCHERRSSAPPLTARPPSALKRPPVAIQPDVEGSFPLTFPRLVQPVVDRHCAPCHRREEEAPSLAATTGGKEGWSQAYRSMAPFAWAKHGGNGAIRRNGSSRSVAGEVGARASRLWSYLKKGHYGVALSSEDWHRLALWLDCNSNFYGAYEKTREQGEGERVLPKVR